MKPEHLDELVELWGEMGTMWGINRSMARVHALLIGSDAPQGLDDISDRLEISRGNASMALKELRSWGVVRRVREAGDRRDFYVSEPDVWNMFFRIARERKKRELDPALQALRRTLAAPDLGVGDDVRRRLEQMEDLLATGDRLLDKLLSDERNARVMFAFVAGMASHKGSS
jgi:DNA-binding transcriptional regulator GbsR (MarR family)